MDRVKSKFAYGLIVWIVLVVGFGTISATPEFQMVETNRIQTEKGKQMLATLEQRSSLPNGNCWKSALATLGAGCKQMQEDMQNRLTFEFVSCYVQMMGMPTFMCPLTTPVSECLQKVNSNPVLQNVYLQYFLHTQDMCYYLSQEIWQEHTNNAVNRLTDAATDVTVQMLEQKLIQEQIYTSQQQSLIVQSNMKKDNEDLYNAVTKVKDVFHEFSETAKEHQTVTVDIFDKLGQLHNSVAWIHGEMSSIDMVIFYSIAIVLGYIGTSIPRTRGARFWLMIMFMLTIAAERKLHTYLTQPEYSYITPEAIHTYVWIVRQVAAIFALLIVLVTYATYRDLQSVNNAMLMNMNYAIDRIAGYVDEMKTKPQGNKFGTGNDADDESDDTYSNYSSDDSRDDLAEELKALKEDAENNENVSPSSPLFSGTKKNFAPSPVLRAYNLRERSSVPRDNPTINQESTTEFAKAIKRASLLPQTPTNVNYFSSDDDEN